MAVPVTAEGQILLPQPIRDRLGLEIGSLVEFEVSPDGRILLVKLDAPQQPSRFAALRGRAGAGPSTNEIMALTRGDELA